MSEAVAKPVVEEAPSAVKVRFAGMIVFVLLVICFLVWAALQTNNRVAIPMPTIPTSEQHRERAKPFEPDSGMTFGPLTPGADASALGATADGNHLAPNSGAGLDIEQIIMAMGRGNGQPPAGPSNTPAPGYYGDGNSSSDAAGVGPIDVEDEIGGAVPQIAPVASNDTGAASTTADLGSTLPPGTIINGALSQSASSDSPDAPLLALVVRDVLHRDGRIAIPKGSRILASVKTHDGPNAAIYDRLTTSVDAIVLPDGRVLDLAAPGLDTTGVSGLEGDRNRHVIAQTAGVLAYALIGAANASATSSDPINTQDQMSRDAMSGAGQQVAPVANRYLSVQDTITSHVTTPITIILKEPLPLT